MSSMVITTVRRGTTSFVPSERPPGLRGVGFSSIEGTSTVVFIGVALLGVLFVWWFWKNVFGIARDKL